MTYSWSEVGFDKENPVAHQSREIPWLLGIKITGSFKKSPFISFHLHHGMTEQRKTV